jgi:uncharacterized protein YukE
MDVVGLHFARKLENLDEKMTSAEKDRVYLETGIPELEDYLLSDELFWPISARGYNLPRLTVGGLLLAKARLEARGERIEALVTKLDAVRSKWAVAWETKAGREFQSRFGLWGNYLKDYRQSPEGHADAYPHEVRNRAMLQLLRPELPVELSEREALSPLDSVVRSSLSPGDFIWEPALQSGFPREEYWFLYGELRS